MIITVCITQFLQIGVYNPPLNILFEKSLVPGPLYGNIWVYPHVKIYFLHLEKLNFKILKNNLTIQKEDLSLRILFA